MLSKTDVAVLRKNFLTKKDGEKFATKEDLKSEISGLRSELKSDILTFKDEILYEVKAMRGEISVVIGYRDQI